MWLKSWKTTKLGRLVEIRLGSRKKWPLNKRCSWGKRRTATWTKWSRIFSESFKTWKRRWLCLTSLKNRCDTFSNLRMQSRMKEKRLKSWKRSGLRWRKVSFWLREKWKEWLTLTSLKTWKRCRIRQMSLKCWRESLGRWKEWFRSRRKWSLE